MSINKHLRGLRGPPSVHFPQQFPNVNPLRFQASPTPRPIIAVSRVPGEPLVIQQRRDRLLHIAFPVRLNGFGFPFRPEDEVEVYQGRPDAEEVPFNGVIRRWERENDRTGSVAWAHILVLGLSLLTTFSVEDVVGFLKPYLIGFAKPIGWFVWERWGPPLVLMAADWLCPGAVPVVMRFVCSLPRRLITRLPRECIALLPPSSIESLPPSCIETLAPSCIETLSPSCIETLSSSCIETLSPSFISRLPQSRIDSLTLDLGTDMEVRLILLQRMVDGISLRVAVLVPWVPVPFVIFAVRFGISFGFWSLSLALWRLIDRFELP